MQLYLYLWLKSALLMRQSGYPIIVKLQIAWIKIKITIPVVR